MERITGATTDPNANGAGKAGFSDSSPSGGLPTVLTPAWANDVQEELASAITGAGLPLDGGSQSQLLAAISSIARAGVSDLVVGGTANAITVTPANGGGAVLSDGFAFKIRAGGNNTAAATLNYNGTGAKSITQADVAGVIRAGVIYSFVYNAASDEYETAGAIGEGQAWRDVEPSRALATDYTNSSGRAICVTATISNTTGGQPAVQALVDSVVVAQENDSSGTTDSTCAFIVPPGSVYRINATSGGAIVDFWAELR